jgi:hypothetical protein
VSIVSAAKLELEELVRRFSIIHNVGMRMLSLFECVFANCAAFDIFDIRMERYSGSAALPVLPTSHAW